MASKETDTRVVDPSREIVGSESELKEEVQRLKQQMSEMCQAWANGQGPPLSYAFPEFAPISATTTPISLSDQFHPFRFSHYPNCTAIAGTYVAHSQSLPLTTSQTTTTVMPVFTIPQPTTVQRKAHESQFDSQQEQYHSPEYHSYLFDLPAKIEKPGPKVASEEITHRLKILEQQLKNMQGPTGQKSVAYRDLCLFPDVQLPVGFKMPKFDMYDGHGDPVAHLRGYCSKMRGAGGKDELLMAYFSQSLSGAALEWYTRQDASRWYTWDDMAQAFARQFQYNIDIVPDRLSLTNVEKKPGESFREYGFRWREQATRVNPPMDEDEMVKYFLRALEPTYYGLLISAIGKSFNDVVKMGEMVEEGLKSSKIMSYSALKATTQAIQNDTGSLPGQKKHDDVAMVVSGSRHGPMGPPHQYIQTRSRPKLQTHPPAPHNPPQYYPLNNVQSFVQPLGYPRRRAPAPRNLHRSPQNFQVPHDLHPSQGRRGKQRLKDDFTPIGESYASLFEKIKHYDMIAPIPPNHVDKRARSFDPSKRCEYHSNAQGHDVETCRDLKREIERMIQEGIIVIQDRDTQNPLPAHEDAHFVGMMHGNTDYENPFGNLLTEVNVIEIGEGPSNFDVQPNG